MRSTHHRSRRLRIRFVPTVLVTGVVAGVALVVPSLPPTTSGDAGAEVTLDSSAGGPASATRASRELRTGVVQWGVDGTGPTTTPPVDPPEASPEAAAPEASGTTASESTASGTTASESTASGTTASGTTASGTTASGTTEETTPAETSRATSAAPAAAGAADPSVEGQVLALVNKERAAAGCGALTADSGLAALARAFSADMRDRGFFSHTDADGLSPFDRGDRAGVTVLAENIAYGQQDAAEVMTSWMNSAGHRKNILNCSYSRIGIGVATGPGGPWWTQDFA